MELELIFSYKENEILRKSFNELSQKTFGINFEEWYQKKLWTNHYECYSIKLGDKILANASVNKYEFIINGEKKKALQIGTVMTDEESRGKGLSKKILNFILDKFENEYEIIYLFANNSVATFYPKFGFKKVKQFQKFSTDKFEKNKKYNLKKLNMNNNSDIDLLRKIGSNRISKSSKFDVMNGHEVMFWYCLNVFRDNIYCDAKEELLLIYSIEDDKLLIHDISSTQPKDYRDIIGSIISNEIKEVSFDFNLESSNIDLKERHVDDDDDILFIKGYFDDNIKVIHPLTSHA